MDPSAVSELIQSAGATAAVVRLTHLNLAKRFPALVAYLIFLAGIDIGFGLINPASELYYWGYIAFEPLECILSIFAVRELFSLAFQNYPGIRTAGRWVMYAGVALAVIISLLVTGFFWTHRVMARGDTRLYYVEVSKRSVVFTLAVVIVAILLFLSKYPLGLNRNTLVSSTIFGVIFLTDASRLLIDSLMPRLFNLYVDWTENVFASICLILWAILLRPEAERTPERVAFSTPGDEHLLQQLNALNQLMARSSRR